MRARPILVLVAALVLSGLGVAPAHAEPAVPTISELATTPGRVTATVLTDQPVVLVALGAEPSDWTVEGTVVPVLGGAAAVDLETWSRGAGTSLWAVACETGTYAAETCSAATATVFDPVTFTVDPLPLFTQTTAQEPATLRTPLRGPYEVSWTLTRDGGEEVVARGPVSGAVPDAGDDAGVIADVVALEDDDPEPAEKHLGSGAWELTVTLTVDDASHADPVPLATVTVPFVVDLNGPQATLGAVRTVIHPLVNLPSHPGTVTVIASGETSEVAGWIVRRNGAPLGQVIRTFDTAATSITWDGRDDDGDVVPPGVYRVHTVDAVGNLSPATATGSWALGVTDKKIITATATKQISAKGALLDASVGRCSTLRKPSLRGTRGSLGLYSNTKCRKGARASQVSTVYGVRLLPAISYVSIRVYTFGGAATRRPRSRATIQYLTNRGLPRLRRQLGATVRTYAGALPPSPGAYVLNVNKGNPGGPVPFFFWNVAVGGGNQYDLRDFVVRIRYRVVV